MTTPVYSVLLESDIGGEASENVGLSPQPLSSR